MVELLLENKADPNLENKYKDVPLTLALERKSLEIWNLLVKHGADLNIRNIAPYDDGNDSPTTTPDAPSDR